MSDQPYDSYHSRMESPVDGVPWRVVSLVPALTETLFDLDLGDRLIAITNYCVRPANKVESVARVGGTRHPDISRIIAMQPDLVLMNDEVNRHVDAKALQAAGVAVWVTSSRTVFDVLNLLWNIMDVFDHPAMVPRVREIERAYDYTIGTSRIQEPVRVFVPLWRDPWITFNKETYAHDVLRVCGGYNICADQTRRLLLEADADQATRWPDDDDPRLAGMDRRFPQVSLDDVTAAQPDVILLPDEPYAFTGDDVDRLYALDVPAAHTGRVHTIDGSLLTWHGTRVTYALRDLPTLLMEES